MVEHIGHRVELAEFVVAVRERRQGPASDATLDARLALAEAYLDADMADDAIEVLLGAVIDAGRLYGPMDERTIGTRLRLGDGYVAADRLYDAYGVHWNLTVEVEAAHSREHPLSREVRAAALCTTALLDALEAQAHEASVRV